MNPGLPGTGIGGLFYTLTALWMPVCEIWRRYQGGATRRWSLVATQFAIAAGVVAATAGVFWVLDTTLFLLQHATSHAAAVGTTHANWTLRVSALVTTSSVLTTLLSAVHMTRLFLWLRAARPAGR
jgi:hypothetical protein